MSLNIVNRLQTIADNDNVSFTNDWPSEYFVNNLNQSFFYIVKNDYNSLNIVRFEYSKNDDGCFKGENPNFCIPSIFPIINNYNYNKNRYLVENIPDFVLSPENIEKIEVLKKDGKFFDNKHIKNLKDLQVPETYKACNFDSENFVTDCITYNKSDDSLLYSEKLDRRYNKAGIDSIYRYTKTSATGKILETYNYTTGVHVIYDNNGEVETYSHVSDDEFCYYTKFLPDLYIDTVFKKDGDGNVIKELLYDRNHKLLRAYSASYNDNKISEIKVNDYINGVDWSIIPIPPDKNSEIPFKIRF